jgi:lysophospholipase L1-like esterase
MLPLLACTPAALVAVPDEGSMAGYVRVRLELEGLDPAGVTAVRVGTLSALDPLPDGDALLVTVQGALEPGAVDVDVETAEETLVFPGAYTYLDNVDPLFDRVVAIGASFTQGVQSGVPTARGALVSPGAVLARQAGAFFTLPLLVDDLFPQVQVEDVGAPPACEVPDIVDFVANAAVEVIGKLSDPETGEFDYAFGRKDASLMPRDLAVGGMKVADVLDGTDDFGRNFVAHLVLDPEGAVTDGVGTFQLAEVEAVEPTLIVSTDLLGNDLIAAVVESRYLDAELATPAEDVAASLEELLPALAATGAEVFIADVPNPTVLPSAQARLRRAVEDGVATQEQADAEAAEIAAIAVAYDDALAAAAAPFANVHVVPMSTRVAAVASTGWPIGETTVGLTTVGGFLSLDGLHFSDTGYGLLAQLFAESIEDELGVALPTIDLGAIYAEDPFNVQTLQSAGLDPTACE